MHVRVLTSLKGLGEMKVASRPTTGPESFQPIGPRQNCPWLATAWIHYIRITNFGSFCRSDTSHFAFGSDSFACRCSVAQLPLLALLAGFAGPTSELGASPIIECILRSHCRPHAEVRRQAPDHSTQTLSPCSFNCVHRS